MEGGRLEQAPIVSWIAPACAPDHASGTRQPKPTGRAPQGSSGSPATPWWLTGGSLMPGSAVLQHLRQRHRPLEQIALCMLAAQGMQQLGLGLLLHAFGHDLDAEALGDAQHG